MKIDIDPKQLPLEIQLKLYQQQQRKESVEDWLCVLLCIGMLSCIVYKPLNNFLDKTINLTVPRENSPPTKVTSSSTNGTVPKSWLTKVNPGDKVGNGLEASARTYFPCTDRSNCTVDPVTGRQGRPHKGQDVPAPAGTPLHVVGLGTKTKVECLSEPNGAGNYAILTPLDWPKGTELRGTSFISMHHQRMCKSGIYAPGTMFATVGTTGHSTGYHIHFGQFNDSGYVHPARGPIEQLITGTVK